MKSKITRIALSVAAMLALGSGVAMASHRHYGGGGRSFYGNVGGIQFGYSSRGYGGSGYGYQNYGYRQPRWHDTSHYHYNPGVVVPHGNHYHYIPGDYQLHRSGHWHY